MRSSDLNRTAARAALVLAAVAAAITVLSDGGLVASGALTADACPAGSAQGPKVAIGTMTRDQPQVFVNRGTRSNRPGSKTEPLYGGSVVCTDQDGSIFLNLKAGVSKGNCVARSLTQLSFGLTKVHAIAIAVRQGGKRKKVTFSCDSRTFVVLPPGSRLESSQDPLFSITIGPAGTSLRVENGFLAVRGRMGSRRVIVGPKQRAVATGGTLSPVAASGPPTQQERRDFARLAGQQPRPSLARPRCVPGRCTSPALLRIFRKKTIVVGLDPAGASDPGVRRFVQGYFRLLARSWKLRLKSTGVRSAADVFVTPTRPARAQTATLFSDRAGQPWLIAARPDPVYFDALTNFLQIALDTGKYASIYRAAFVKAPAYAPLASLIFPPTTCVPGVSTSSATPPNVALKLSATPSGPVPGRAIVIQTADVLNMGERADCVTVRLHVFGASLLTSLKVRPAGACTEVAASSGDRAFRCQVGPLDAGEQTRLSAVERPAALAPGQTVQTCADVNADESGSVPEVARTNNGACVQILGRRPLLVGAAEDAVQQPSLAGTKAKLELMRLAGLDAVEVTAVWTPGETDLPAEQLASLTNVAAAAQLAGVRVFLSVYNADSRVTPIRRADQVAFAAFAAAAARAVPLVGDVIVGNEPNNNYFWLPQFTRGADAAAPAYASLLALSYDALKAVNPNLRVVGGALAPRGADEPGADRNTHSPVQFIQDLGDAYKASSRMRPIMDAFAFHPMPESPSVSPALAYRASSTALGIADFDRLVGLLGRGFDGTNQLGSKLPVLYTEYGVETRIPPAKAGAYTGFETTDPVDAATQARSYAQALGLAACQPTVEALLLFHAFDEPALDRWQSGVYYADETPKPSLEAVRRAADVTGTRDTASCPVAVSAP